MSVPLVERLREHRALLTAVVLHECKRVGVVECKGVGVVECKRVGVVRCRVRLDDAVRMFYR